MEYIMTPYADSSTALAWWDDAFSVEELDILQNLARNTSSKGIIGRAGGTLDTDARRSYVEWLHFNTETAWLFNKISHILSSINAQYFNFDITGFGEPIQLSDYRSCEKGTYDWHIDRSYTGINRKLSFVMQLSDPGEYEGGELEIMTDTAVPIKINKKRGLITVFPSWTLHRVTPVTSGTRQSLVVWVSGPKFR